MADNVTPFDGSTLADIPADTILDAAKGKLSQVVLIGWEGGGELYVASSTADPAAIYRLLIRAGQATLERDE